MLLATPRGPVAPTRAGKVKRWEIER